MSDSNSSFRSLRRALSGLVLIAVFAVNAYQAAGSLRLIAQGDSTVGNVVDVRSRSGNGRTKYTVDYSYEHNGKTYTGSTLVSRPDYEALHSDDPISVAYLPHSPETSDYKDGLWKRLWYSLIPMAICGFIMVLGAAMTIASRSSPQS